MLGNIFKKGAFTYDPNMTPQQLADKRAMLAMLQPRYGKASYIGEGLGQLATGVATGIRTRKLDEIEGKGREKGADLFSSLFGGTTQSTSGQSGPMNILGVDPIALPDPSSPEGIANDTMAALGKNVDFTPGDRESFIKAMTPHAMRVAEITGLDPRLVIAQAAQETGWGKSAPNNNFFGIKSHGKGGGGTFATTEYIGGKPVTVNDSFRGYSDMGDSAMGYAQFLMENPRYKAMLAAGDLDGQLAALGESGYATDPNYASSVGSIARGISLGGPVAAPAGASTATNSAMPNIDPQALASALANPWLSPEQRSVLMTIYDQQVQAGDPLRQIEVAKGMAELEKMNAPPAPPEDFTTRIFLAQQAGLEPGTPEFQTYLLTGKLPEAPEPGYNMLTPEEVAQLGLPPGAYQRGGDGKISEVGKSGVTVNVGGDGAPGLGKLSPDYGYVLDPETRQPVIDPQTGLPMAAPVPGSPAAQEKDAAAATADRAGQNAATATEVVTSAAARAREANAKRSVGGVFGQWATMNPSSENAELYRQVDVLKSNAKVENLNAMRQASPTGGALGSVTEKEADMLAAKSGALDPASPYFERDLADYELTLLRTVHGFDEGNRVFNELYPEGVGGITTGGAAPAGDKSRKRYNPATGAFE